MFRRIRLAGILAAVSLFALFALLSVAGAAPRAAETKDITIKDFEFDPKTITVNVGDTIHWKNTGQKEHTAQADDGSFNSGDLEAGKEFSFTFSKAGTFPYYCKYHGGPGGKGMSGTITVAEAGAPAAAPAQPTAAPAAAAQQDSIDVDDQPIKNGSITVGEIYASQDGWIVAHLDEGGKPGKVIGHTAVKKGESTNVPIKLEQDVPVGGKLWPMLHIDAGTIGTYEFPGPDAPVIVNGNIVMKQITVTAAAANQPAKLPRTGGDGAPAGLLPGALALLIGGALLALRMRRRA
ncbi:MAG TPA: cupredoxin domain-containing protein [Roseiflexaceae bacterium]